MSAEKGLGDAVTEAQARVAERIATPAEPRPAADARATLRRLATLYGLKPDAVVASFDAGGPLADLVRAVLVVEARRPVKRGPRLIAARDGR